MAENKVVIPVPKDVIFIMNLGQLLKRKVMVTSVR
jgi:hypothetical protein